MSEATPSNTATDLRHHGDVDAEPGLQDFAVNVRGTAPPAWLRERLVHAVDRLGTYPSAADDRRAREAVGERHGRDPGEVLVLNGAAEGFALLPALRPRLAALLHPSFTEPEVSLRDADVPVHHVFDMAVPDDADLVVVGNPNNPTSELRPAAEIARMARPGRVLVVDEAFMDAVPGERESLASADLPGLVVLRSLTKTWALPGLRAGYALGAPDLLRRLGRHRPHWPVGTLALEAVTACAEPHAVAEAERAARELAAHREWLTAELNRLPGVHVLLPAAAPYLLLRVRDGERVRAGLRDRGIAVRRGDTFPGLTADHLRVAVREPARCAGLLTALAELTAGLTPEVLTT
ncbi:histidinol-phosphate aminotransferase [Actinophytocola algeriensis]|uniref:Aminotransferase n=2 Tax=Actinophytocola algeriensis TaxID=1768010 RepID=A0A7W7QDA3_9PSEU|nr:histidinol-phosphate aminotransferase [Actinophytocola algeriensis]MBE1479393.1 histidinol-phosphate aminotransferase [Actinophytocola algeriensis]